LIFNKNVIAFHHSQFEHGMDNMLAVGAVSEGNGILTVGLTMR
jgi:hypothetical protein